MRACPAAGRAQGVSRAWVAAPPAVEDLLLWRDPKKSGAVLGGATVAFLFLSFAKINFISTLAYTLLSLVLGAFLWNNIASFTKK